MTNTTQVVLVRHAETLTITNQRIHGQTDGPLSEKGMRDAQKTAEYFRGHSFDAFYSSPLGRAMKTAQTIGSAINMQPELLDGFKERYYGWLEGKAMKWFEPDLSGPKITLPLVKFALWASGESGDTFVRRIITTFDTVADRNRGKRVLIVLHWGILSVLTQYLQRKDLKVWRGIGPWTACGISEYHLINEEWQPIYMDKGNHLL